ncbi:FKBP-type peptidyl-prolyl cis-trans isomerase [Arthrobacter sp. NEB 688]|uniref:FKBP-type peptidyl-prolyl cis-trans isomerase n=1 Tax=Arthrobacter sp. NEB 688 TaxID=904039 RepID=UPI0015664674|nr:FKBP-type peptidyl-prolyl cis-trans isomerase [Arthrobacter sp. NEB 688]QKE84768.1 FKBP-type peptidylprolyl isomerase [Arthrobacter sp. NEB 688]
MPRRLTSVLSVSALAGALLLTGCGEEEATTPSSSISGVTVTGEAQKEPKVTVKAPVTVSRTQSQVLSEGDGAAVTQDDLVTLQAILVNGKDGKVVTSTWKSGTVGLDLGDQNLFASFKSQIPGKKIGTRMVIASTPADAYGDTGNQQLGITKDDPVIFVLDLVGATKVLDEAQGTAVAPKKGLPTVTMNAGKPATITPAKGAKAPSETVVQPLVEGTGAEVKKGQTVRVAYTGALYRNGEVFDSSANRPEQPFFEFKLGEGQVIKGWDTGLEGQKVGSRVLLVIPPKDGYGDAGSGDKIKGTDTLVFAVDILAAY